MTTVPAPPERRPRAAPTPQGPVAPSATRIEAPDKVTGRARYAYEHPLADLVYVSPVPSTIAKGEIRALPDDDIRARPGVLAVITPDNAPRLARPDDAELALFQSPAVAYRGQWIAAVVATTLEGAREAAEQLAGAVDYDVARHDVVLTADHPGLYAPDHVNPNYATDTAMGDVDAAFASAAVRIDETYRTPGQHNNPMEPHATVATWDGDELTLFESTQGPSGAKAALAQVFDVAAAQVHIVSEHVGGGFGAKGSPRPNAVLAGMAARVVSRPVKCAVTRQQMFAVVGHRTPSIQRVRLGAEPDGRLTAIAHDVVEQSSTLREFAEQTAVATRHMYAAPHRRTTHRLARLDVPTPAWMRAPGECPGMYALESAMDELAVACGIDPVELRIRNEPEVEPESSRPFSSPEPDRVPARGSGPLRLERPGSAARREARRALAGRHRRGGVDLPGARRRVAGPRPRRRRRPLRGRAGRVRHRHRCPDGAHPDRRRGARCRPPRRHGQDR